MAAAATTTCAPPRTRSRPPSARSRPRPITQSDKGWTGDFVGASGAEATRRLALGDATYVAVYSSERPDLARDAVRAAVAAPTSAAGADGDGGGGAAGAAAACEEVDELEADWRDRLDDGALIATNEDGRLGNIRVVACSDRDDTRAERKRPATPRARTRPSAAAAARKRKRAARRRAKAAAAGPLRKRSARAERRCRGTAYRRW